MNEYKRKSNTSARRVRWSSSNTSGYIKVIWCKRCVQQSISEGLKAERPLLLCHQANIATPNDLGGYWNVGPVCALYPHFGSLLLSLCLSCKHTHWSLPTTTLWSFAHKPPHIDVHCIYMGSAESMNSSKEPTNELKDINVSVLVIKTKKDVKRYGLSKERSLRWKI